MNTPTQKHLFTTQKDKSPQPTRSFRPLAERMRPKTIDEIVGQQDLLGTGSILRTLIENDQLSSIVLFGPPGCGKTTIAHVIAHHTKSQFIAMSATSGSIKEAREFLSKAREDNLKHNIRTIVFVDEIHRFNKLQQDAFLPSVETGDIILIGATTENPSFEVNSALLSRSRVFALKKIETKDVINQLKKAIKTDTQISKQSSVFSEEIIEIIAKYAHGDLRIGFGALEMCAVYAKSHSLKTLSNVHLETILQSKTLFYDKNGEEHYNLISALHKSLRDSDPDGALYWMTRMIMSGEDPLYIARRLVRFASEDIGLADPQALIQALAAKDAIHFLGIGEGNLALSQACIYLALAQKSNAIYTAANMVQEDVNKTIAEPVPLHLRNAPTKLMKNLGYSKGYKYAHDFKNAKVKQEHLPTSLHGKKYYLPKKENS